MSDLMAGKTFHVVVEKDEDGWFVGSVPELPGCHTQGESMADLMANIREAIELYLEAKGMEGPTPTFVSVQPIEV
jgi:predicted RNase H-like HicB family nuclease